MMSSQMEKAALLRTRLLSSYSRLEDDVRLLRNIEASLRSPNIGFGHLADFSETLEAVETRLQSFSTQDISAPVREVLLGDDLSSDLYRYLEQRSLVQTQLLSVQQKLDTQVLLKEEEKQRAEPQPLSTQVQVLSQRTKEVAKELHNIQVSVNSLSLPELINQTTFLGRRVEGLGEELKSGFYSPYQSSGAFQQLLKVFDLVHSSYQKLLASIAERTPTEHDMVTVIESLRTIYRYRIPVHELAKAFRPIDPERVYETLKRLIRSKQLTGAWIDTMGTASRADDLLVLGGGPTQHRDTTTQERTHLFKRVLQRFDRIKVSSLASILGLEDQDELYRWLLNLPDEFGFAIDQDLLVIKQDLLVSQIDELLALFEESGEKM